MRKFLILIAIVASLFSMGVAQTTEDDADTRELKQIEKGLLRIHAYPYLQFALEKLAEKKSFPTDLNVLLADDYVRIGLNGERINKQQEIARLYETSFPGPMTTGMSYSFAIDNNYLQFRFYGQTAVVTKTLLIKRSSDGGEETKEERRVTTVYVKRDRQWQAVSSQETAIKD